MEALKRIKPRKPVRRNDGEDPVLPEERRRSRLPPGDGVFRLSRRAARRRDRLRALRTSRLSIAKFGFEFWRTKTWDPVAGDFGALPFIWGTLYSSFLALLISTPIALGIAIFLSELSPGFLRTPLAFLTELLAAIPSIVYGLWGIFVLVPLVRQLEVLTPDWMRKIPLFSGPAARRRHALRGA